MYKLTIRFGERIHGWLPVVATRDSVRLNFVASDTRRRPVRVAAWLPLVLAVLTISQDVLASPLAHQSASVKPSHRDVPDERAIIERDYKHLAGISAGDEISWGHIVGLMARHNIYLYSPGAITVQGFAVENKDYDRAEKILVADSLKRHYKLESSDNFFNVLGNYKREYIGKKYGAFLKADSDAKFSFLHNVLRQKIVTDNIVAFPVLQAVRYRRRDYITVLANHPGSKKHFTTFDQKGYDVEVSLTNESYTAWKTIEVQSWDNDKVSPLAVSRFASTRK